MYWLRKKSISACLFFVLVHSCSLELELWLFIHWTISYRIWGMIYVPEAHSVTFEWQCWFLDSPSPCHLQSPLPHSIIFLHWDWTTDRLVCNCPKRGWSARKNKIKVPPLKCLSKQINAHMKHAQLERKQFLYTFVLFKAKLKKSRPTTKELA